MTLTKNRGVANYRSKGQNHNLPVTLLFPMWASPHLGRDGVRRLISRQRASKGGQQPNRDQKAAVFLSHNFKFGKILRASTTGSPHRVAPGKFRCRWR
jgi:hypothetical protein